MTADKLPSVLFVPCSTAGYSNSLSVERVLKQALELLEQCDVSPSLEDRLITCLDDLGTLLAHIDR